MIVQVASDYFHGAFAGVLKVIGHDICQLAETIPNVAKAPVVSTRMVDVLLFKGLAL